MPGKGRIFILKMEKWWRDLEPFAHVSLCSCDIYVARYYVSDIFIIRGTCAPEILYIHTYVYVRMCVHMYICESGHVISELTVINRDKRCEGWTKPRKTCIKIAHYFHFPWWYSKKKSLHCDLHLDVHISKLRS